MKPSVYLETTIPSYLTARPSNDLLRAAHQRVTIDWWTRRDRFRLFVAQLVLDECASGDPEAATKRLQAIQDLPVLTASAAALELSAALVRGASLPSRAIADALHVAIAAVHGMDYFLTWNCRHIINVAFQPRVTRICRQAGYEPPLFVTPLEFREESGDD